MRRRQSSFRCNATRRSPASVRRSVCHLTTTFRCRSARYLLTTQRRAVLTAFRRRLSVLPPLPTKFADTARARCMRVHLLGLSIMFADAWTVPGAMLPDRAPSSVPHCAPICGVRALGAGGRAHVNADFSQGALKKTRKHGRGGGSRINVIMLMTATRRRNSPTHTEIEIAFFRILTVHYSRST